MIFSDCGLTNAEALKTATSNAARILGKSECLGYIREGYLADLVILDDNPLVDLHAVGDEPELFRKDNPTGETDMLGH